jgi:cell division protein ZapE
MTLIAQYDSAVARQEITDDPVQRGVIAHMQRVIDELSAYEHSWLPWLKKKRVQGIYLYGPVGVGKTYLGDLFYSYLPEKQKTRLHFHHFMQQVDAQLRRLQGQRDPLRRIAAHIAKTTRVLCFDEFMVYDVADAMILAELLHALFAKGIVLMITSNIPPDQLYLNGQHRERFLPAIDLIKQHCEIVAIADHADYRLGRAPLQQAYIYPLNEQANALLTKQFNEAVTNIKEKEELCIQNRMIACVKWGKRAVWFRFDVICNLPRSQLDYLEIADRFDTVFVSDIPKLTEKDTVNVILLIHFIDVMYDRGIQLILSAAVPVDELYTQGELSGKFQRTLSRLKEMQSQDYARRHRWRKEEGFSDSSA